MKNQEKSNNEVLEAVRIYEEKHINDIPKGQRPSFHLSSPIGWINDPNGFSQFGGDYHLFYQYHPYDTRWGPMHWGHSKTKDFIKWDQLPAALAPDKTYDLGGCFSGSAIEDNGKHILIYTGVLDETQEDGTRFIRQTQCMAIGDGVNYTKLDCNPVITSDSLPQGSSLEDFRDPKIWKDGECFYVVVGSRNEDGSGQILLYKSKDLKEWTYVTTIDKSTNKIGRMWECPDFFNIDGNDIMIISPQEMKAEGLKFHNGNNTAYLIGQYNKDTNEFIRENCMAIDYGLDFYAPQTLETEDGRRIMVAWMQTWESNIVPTDFKWRGMMTLPREITVREGKLIQTPVKEIEQYYKNTVEYNKLSINGAMNLNGISGREMDMIVEIDGGDYEKFQIKIAKNHEYETLINYDRSNNLVVFDRSYSGRYGDTLHKREMNVRNGAGKIKLRLIVDKYSVEIFVNNGEQVMTSTFYTDLDATDISFYSKGNAKINVKKHDIVLE